MSGTASVTVTQTLTSISVSPPSASVAVSGAQQFTATARDQFGNPMVPQPTFTWTVSGGGTISSSGLFTAASTPGGPYTVTAANGSVSGTASVTVTQTLTSISVSPPSASVAVSGAQQFTATARDQFGNPMVPQPTFTWTVSGGGTISSSGLFTAASTPGGPYTVTAANGSVSGTASVTVTQTLTSISVSPPSASVAVSGAQQFTATARDQFGNPMVPQPTFTWTVSGGGTISSSGLFTAASTPGGPYTVTAANGSVSGTASVTVTQTLTSISVSPPSASVAVSGTQQFTATARDQFDNPMVPQPTFTWTVSGGGTISSSGLFTAASAPGGPYTVTAASGSVSGTASVTVTQTLTSISVSPPSASVAVSGTQQFTATARDQFGNPMVPQPTFTWTVSGGGTISSSGLFTAASTPGGPYTVRAANGSVSGTASVTVTQTLTSISVSPPSASVAVSGAQQFTATARDQFGNPMVPQPTFTWTVSGGGTISSSGLFTAASAPGGPYTVTAASGSVSGTASERSPRR